MPGTPFTDAEIVLCSYAARYNSDDFGGIDAIHALTRRSLPSINMKISNIAAMLDEAGVARSNEISPLSGVTTGQQGRRTNWDIVSKLVPITRDEHLVECEKLLLEAASLPGEILDRGSLVEGAVRSVLVNRYERDAAARQLCLDHYGSDCFVCGFCFGATYGDCATGFIHVHHLKPLSEIGVEYVVDPIADLRPVCPNCHAVIHLGGSLLSIEDAKELLKRRKGTT